MRVKLVSLADRALNAAMEARQREQRQRLAAVKSTMPKALTQADTPMPTAMGIVAPWRRGAA